MNYKIIIPTYKENEHLSNCLNWLSMYSHLENVLIVNDNDKDYPRLNIEDVIVLDTGGNAWWSGSINIGIKRAMLMDTEYFILLNSDNWGESDVITELLKKAQHNKNVIHAATVANQDRVVRCTTGHINFENFSVNMFNNGRTVDSLNKRVLYGNYNGGMAVVLSIDVLRNVGLFDENLPLSADREFFYRAFNSGIPVCSYEEIVIYTDDSHKAIDRDDKRNNKLKKILEPLNFRSPYYYRNIHYFYSKYSNKPVLFTLLSLIYFYQPFKRLYSLLMQKYK